MQINDESAMQAAAFAILRQMNMAVLAPT